MLDSLRHSQAEPRPEDNSEGTDIRQEVDKVIKAVGEQTGPVATRIAGISAEFGSKVGEGADALTAKATELEAQATVIAEELRNFYETQAGKVLKRLNENLEDHLRDQPERLINAAKAKLNELVGEREQTPETSTNADEMNEPLSVTVTERARRVAESLRDPEESTRYESWRAVDHLNEAKKKAGEELAMGLRHLTRGPNYYKGRNITNVKDAEVDGIAQAWVEQLGDKFSDITTRESTQFRFEDFYSIDPVEIRNKDPRLLQRIEQRAEEMARNKRLGIGVYYKPDANRSMRENNEYLIGVNERLAVRNEELAAETQRLNENVTRLQERLAALEQGLPANVIEQQTQANETHPHEELLRRNIEQIQRGLDSSPNHEYILTSETMDEYADLTDEETQAVRRYFEENGWVWERKVVQNPRNKRDTILQSVRIYRAPVVEQPAPSVTPVETTAQPEATTPPVAETPQTPQAPETTQNELPNKEDLLARMKAEASIPTGSSENGNKSFPELFPEFFSLPAQDQQWIKQQMAAWDKERRETASSQGATEAMGVASASEIKLPESTVEKDPQSAEKRLRNTIDKGLERQNGDYTFGYLNRYAVMSDAQVEAVRKDYESKGFVWEPITVTDPRNPTIQRVTSVRVYRPNTPEPIQEPKAPVVEEVTPEPVVSPVPETVETAPLTDEISTLIPTTETPTPPVETPVVPNAKRPGRGTIDERAAKLVQRAADLQNRTAVKTAPQTRNSVQVETPTPITPEAAAPVEIETPVTDSSGPELPNTLGVEEQTTEETLGETQQKRQRQGRKEKRKQKGKGRNNPDADEVVELLGGR